MTTGGIHMSMRPTHPPGHPDRQWYCTECRAQAPSPNDLPPCTAPDPESCEWCGQTPECSRECTGVALALSGIDPSTMEVGDKPYIAGDPT